MDGPHSAPLFWNAILLPPQTSNNRVPEKWYHNNSSRSRPPPTTISSISTTPHAIEVLYAVIRGRPSRASFPRRRPAAVTFLHSSEAPPHPPCLVNTSLWREQNSIPKQGAERASQSPDFDDFHLSNNRIHNLLSPSQIQLYCILA